MKLLIQVRTPKNVEVASVNPEERVSDKIYGKRDHNKSTDIIIFDIGMIVLITNKIRHGGLSTKQSMKSTLRKLKYLMLIYLKCVKNSNVSNIPNEIKR